MFGKTSTEDYIEQCSSLPKRYFVLNEATRQIYPFIVLHENQQSPRQQLKLSTRNGNLSAEQQQSLMKALDAKQQLLPALMEVSQHLTKTVSSNASSPPQTTLFNQTFGDDPHPGTSCASDAHTAALSNALSSQYRYQMQNSVRADFAKTIQQGKYDSLKSAFTEWQFTSLGMQGGPASAGFNISWQHQIGAYHFSEYYRATDGSTSELVWGISLNANNALELHIDPQTSGIDSVTLADLLSSPTSALPPKISSCLVKVLQDHYYAKTVFERGNEGQTEYFDKTTDMIGRTETRDGGWICLYSHFDTDGKLKMQYLAKCP